jgi:plastocyanin
MTKMLLLPLLLMSSLAAAETREVGIINMKFEPETLVIKPGDTVRWVNKEKRTYHTVLFKGEAVAESQPLFPGDSHERRFEQPGTYPYICGPHPHMTAEIRVQP